MRQLKMQGFILLGFCNTFLKKYENDHKQFHKHIKKLTLVHKEKDDYF